MSKLRHFFHGYLKHYLAWLAFFVVMGAIFFISTVSNQGGLYLAEVGVVLVNIVITAPILAFITLSIYKGLRKIFGSKDII